VRLHRFFDMVQELTNRYPDDPEAWNILGEADDHLGPFLGRPSEDQLHAFNRSIALDSAYAPSYIHPIEVAARSGREAMQRYLTPYLRLVGNSRGDGARLVQTLLDSLPSEPDRLRLFQGTSDDGLFSAYVILSSLADSNEFGLSLTRYIARHPLSSPPLNNSLSANRAWARAPMSRGHLREGLARIPAGDTTQLFSGATLLGAVPRAIAANYFREMMADASALPTAAFPWWAGQGDVASLHQVQRRADSLARWSADPAVRSRARYVQASTTAYLELAKHDTTRAIDRFLSLPQDLCPSCYLDRLTLAQILMESQRHQDAWKILQADHPVQTLAPEATAVLWWLLRGRVAERLGKRETAIRAYQWVADMWKRPDPELKPYANEAKEGLSRLTAEKR
jgi:hypothetical protein